MPTLVLTTLVTICLTGALRTRRVRSPRVRSAVARYEELMQHRIRNSLAMAKGAAATLLDDSLALEPAVRRQLLEVLAEGIERIETLSLSPRTESAGEVSLMING